MTFAIRNLFFFLVIVFLSTKLTAQKEKQWIPLSQDGMMEYYQPSATMVFSNRFLQSSIFSEGLALVQTTEDGSKWGYVDRKGNFVIPPRFGAATIFREGLAWVSGSESPITAINKKGEIRFVLDQANLARTFHQGLAAFSTFDTNLNEKWGFVDKTGKIVIPPNFENVGDFNVGFCKVQVENGKWGYINRSGRMVIPAKYDYADNFSNKLAVVTVENKYGIIDRNGKFTLQPTFEFILQDGDKFLVSADSKHFWCDKHGKLLNANTYDEALPFGNSNLAAVAIGEYFSYVNSKGVVVLKTPYEKIFPFIGSKALVYQDQSYGLMDKSGKVMFFDKNKSVATDYLLHSIFGFSMFEQIERGQATKQLCDCLLELTQFYLDSGFTNFSEDFVYTQGCKYLYCYKNEQFSVAVDEVCMGRLFELIFSDVDFDAVDWEELMLEPEKDE